MLILTMNKEYPQNSGATRKVSFIEVVIGLQEGRMNDNDIWWMAEVNDKVGCYQSSSINNVKEELITLLQCSNFETIFKQVSPDCIDCFLLAGDPGEIIMMGEAIGVDFYGCLSFPDEKTAEIIRREMLEFCHTIIKKPKDDVSLEMKLRIA